MSKNILNTSEKFEEYKRCWQSKEGYPSVVLLGDSHAEHLFYGFADNLPNQNVVFYIRGGRPSFNDKKFIEIFNELKKSKGDGKYVIIATHWIQDLKGDYLKDLRDVIQVLKDLKYSIAILGDTPVFKAKPSSCLVPSRVILRPMPKGCEMSIENAKAQKEKYEPFLTQFADDEDLIYLSANYNFLCNNSVCSMVVNNRLLYRDKHHLNEYGSKLFGGDFAKRLKSVNFFK